MTKRIGEDKQKSHQRRWQAHVKAIAQSGLSRAEYCRRHNLSYHALAYWQRKFSQPTSTTTTLVPITLQTDAGQKARQHDQAELQINLPGKMSIAVGDNFSPATLNRLLTVLEHR